MSYLLCHECYTWVEPHGDRCPDCAGIVDASRPDPPADVLETAMGELVCRLGEVRVRRKLLPDVGTLYATTRGLCFVPLDVRYEARMVDETPPGASFVWLMASIAWAPLALVTFLFPLKRPVMRHVPIWHPASLEPGDRHRLPELLMANPGVFFVPRRSIRAIRSGWFRMTIDRIVGSRLTLTPQSDRRELRQYLKEFGQNGTWRPLAVR